MGTLGAIGRAWDRYCRQMGPEEAGALWGLVSMAHGSRVRGCVVARAGVLAAAWNLGEGEAAEGRALEILEGLKKKGAVTVSVSGPALLVTVGMFGDGWERRRMRERARHGSGKRSEVGGQRSEVGGRRSEIRGRRSEVGDQRSEIRGRRSEVGEQRAEETGKRVGA